MVHHLCQSRGIYGEYVHVVLVPTIKQHFGKGENAVSFREGIFDGGFMISFILQGLLWLPECFL